ncbi:MAG: hypothetical protein HZC36_09180 [Armatimonadetes bacterium]|nr:hypothetical protein [Armatimonadota bacterium]
MRTHSLAWVAAVLALAGCQSAPKVVKVDLAQVAEPGLEAAPSKTPNRVLNSVEAPQSDRLFELKEPEAARGDGRRAQRAQQTLDRGRNAAMRALREKLYRSYAKEAEAWRLEQVPAQEAFARLQWDRVEEASSRLLQQSAPDQGVRLAELSFLVGFPAPATSGAKTSTSAAPWQVRRWERAQELLTEIQKMENDRIERRNGLLTEAQDAILASRAKVQLEYANRLDRALEMANEEAEQSARASRGEFRSDLASMPEPPTIQLPATPVGSRSIAGSAGREIASAQGAKVGPKPFSRARHDLEIWLALKGYRLATASEPARDATQEFIAWRRTHLPGR